MNPAAGYGISGFNLTQTYPTASAMNDDSPIGKGLNLISNVIPTALQLGIEAAQTDAAIQSGIVNATKNTLTALDGTGTTASATLSSSWLSTARQTIGVIGGLGGLFNIISQWGHSTPTQGAVSGGAIGAAIGSFIPGLGTGFGAAIGVLAGGLLGCIKTGKHKDQLVRDQMRNALVNSGVLDQSYSIKLGDGTLYNMGLDGSPRAELGGRRPYEIDFNNPLAKYAVSWMNPIIDLLCNGNEKLKVDFVGYFANAALTNAKSLDDVRKNVHLIMQKFSVTDQSLAEMVTYAQKTGRFSEQLAAVYLNGIRERGGA